MQDGPARDAKRRCQRSATKGVEFAGYHGRSCQRIANDARRQQPGGLPARTRLTGNGVGDKLKETVELQPQ